MDIISIAKNEFKDLDVFLQVPLLVRRVYAGEVHPVETAVLLCFVPVGLQKIISFRGDLASPMFTL